MELSDFELNEVNHEAIKVEALVSKSILNLKKPVPVSGKIKLRAKGLYEKMREENITMLRPKSLFILSLAKVASDGRNIDFMIVFKDVLITNQIQIDLESAANLYDSIREDGRLTELSNNINLYMTTSEDLDIMIEGEVGLILKKVGKSVDEKGKISFQRTNTPKAIALALLNTLNNKMFGNISSTDGAAIKKFVNDYAKSLLGEKNATGKKTVDLLLEMLEKNMKSSDFTGTSEDLFEAMKGVLGDIASKIADPSIRATFEHEIQKIREAAFSLGITTSPRKQILYDILKESHLGKETKNGRVVDWNKINFNGKISENLNEVLSEKLDSIEIGFKGNKQLVYDALVNEYKEIQKASIYLKASDTYKNDLTLISPGRLSGKTSKSMKIKITAIISFIGGIGWGALGLYMVAMGFEDYNFWTVEYFGVLALLLITAVSVCMYVIWTSFGYKNDLNISANRLSGYSQDLTKFNKGGLFFVLSILLILMVTNPNMSQFKDYTFCQDDNMEDNQGIRPIRIRQSNYLIFSIYEIVKPLSSNEKKRYRGILSNFYEIY